MDFYLRKIIQEIEEESERQLIQRAKQVHATRGGGQPWQVTGYAFAVERLAYLGRLVELWRTDQQEPA